MTQQRRPPRRKGQGRAVWSPTMERRAASDGRQVKCLIASAGHLWMQDYFDRFPPAIRLRLAQSEFNICPACLAQEARRVASQHHVRLTVTLYIAVIEAIEQMLMEDT